MSPNGRLLSSELTTIEGLPLGKKTANAYARLKAAAKAAGVDIWIAQPIGGYRSFAVQADMKVNPGKYGLSTVSTVNIASAGYSTHGLGNALDIGSFGSAYGSAGAKRSAWLIQHAPEFGFFREFGDKDPNHFHHDGFTAVDPIISAAGTVGGTIQEDDMPTANEITQELRNAVWLLGPNGEPLRVEQALKDIANRQQTIIDLAKGYGARTEDLHVNLVPAILARLAALPGGVPVVTTELANAILPALLHGLGDAVVTDDDLAASLAPIAEALGKLPDEVRATLKAAL